MQESVETRLQALMLLTGEGPDAERETLYRDVLLVKLAQQVGASVRGVYDEAHQMRVDEIARRIREAEAQNARAPRKRTARQTRQHRRGLSRHTWMLASLLFLSFATVTFVSVLAYRMGLLPSL